MGELLFMQEPDFQVSAEPSIFETIITPGRSSSEYRNTGAFAVLKKDGSVVSWGKIFRIRKTLTIRLPMKILGMFIPMLKPLLVSSKTGLLSAGADEKWGGNSSRVKDELQTGIQSIASTKRAFTALREDGFVTSWERRPWWKAKFFIR